MKKLALGLCLAGFLAACGGGDDDGGDVTPVPDASNPNDPDASVTPPACNPLGPAGNQGCNPGEKCTWIRIAETPDRIGKVGCVPDGTVDAGAACTDGEPGETTGYDNCKAGLICIGTCKDICGFDGSANAACATGEACTRYADTFSNGDEDPIAGACNPTCDPLTQTRMVAGNPNPTDCGTNQGCYLLATSADTIAVCASAGMPTHNQPIPGTSTGEPTYANSCAPGHVPRQAVQGVTGNECASLCKPADVTSTTNMQYEGGDSRVLNFRGTAADCVHGAAPGDGDALVDPNVPTTGESCQYYWTREPTENITAFSNTLGWCFQVRSWKYDPDGMQPINNTADYPRCITVTTGDVIPPVNAMTPHNDAIYFGCMALPTMLQSVGRNAVRWHHRFEPKMDRLQRPINARH